MAAAPCRCLRQLQPRPARLRRPLGGAIVTCAAQSADGPFEGEFGQWWVTPADKVEVWSYRASLTLVAAAFGAGTAAALAPQDAGWAPALWSNGSLLAAAGGVGILGATTLIHIYITPIKRALQTLAALGCAGGAWLALQHSDVPLPQYVADHPGSMWFVGPAFAALAGICFKEGFCYEKRESFILSGLIPLLCLLHLTGLMPELADKGFSAVVAGMLLLFAVRKYTQPVFADIGDKTIFEWQAMTEDEQRARLEQIRLEVAAYGEDEEVV
ncbi:integral membrane [Chlorella sorokiniana]|uniref:Integral membrane n=1 Tax=Chlorella sorokiniana TaxID=3076 RepID=A0A2P6TKR6_CHLSO|nr:integral membrane [Chlorella sorokiniana]|eukprot:PRW44865.1 integral membrane [Chlorella sorokiniana]